MPVMVGPLMTARTKVELRDRTMRAPGVLARAGVKVAIITDHWVVPIQLLILQVILAVQGGHGAATAALRAVTINPAEIMGVADRLGSLEAGKDADLQILSGHPLDAMARVEQVFVGGQQAYDYAAARADLARGPGLKRLSTVALALHCRRRALPWHGACGEADARRW